MAEKRDLQKAAKRGGQKRNPAFFIVSRIKNYLWNDPVSLIARGEADNYIGNADSNLRKKEIR